MSLSRRNHWEALSRNSDFMKDLKRWHTLNRRGHKPEIFIKDHSRRAKAQKDGDEERRISENMKLLGIPHPLSPDKF